MFTEMDYLRLEIYRLISKSFIELETTDRQLMNQFNLSVTQYWALVHLEDPEGLPLSELAFLLIRDRSNMTSLVDKLEKEGLAERKYGKNGDRRFTRVALTEKGHQLRSRVIVSHNYLINRRLETLSEESLRELRARLLELSDKLHSQLKNDEISSVVEDAVQLRLSQTEIS
ncbi:MAG TPA: MarR family transcriptional regulator [Ktedonobacteraceae bacterium]|nr:MarR family transcriptional regulator [Ktedonobacteraceae bacterium]